MSDKNLLCLVLTFGLAFFAIGNAFRAGNFILGFETLVIWFVVYSIMPLVIIIDRKIDYEKAPVDLMAVLFKTVKNNYLFISFCVALLLSILFDDLMEFIGHFVEDLPHLDLPIVALLISASALFSLVFYILSSKSRIEKLKNYGTRVDAQVKDVKILNNSCYVKACVNNPATGEQMDLITITYTDDKESVPAVLPVYFDEKNDDEYYFDAYSWLEQ